MGLLLYQLPGVAILLQSLDNPSFLFSSGSGRWEIFGLVVQGSDYGYFVGYGMI